MLSSSKSAQEARADEALAWIKQFGFTALDLNLDSGWSSEMAAEGIIGPHRLNTDWEGFLDALIAIGYEGTLNFETATAVYSVPEPLQPAMLRLIGEIGSYFRSRLLAKSEK